MPHFHIEYSANLEQVVDMGQLCEAVRAEAAAIHAFPVPGVRMRATHGDHHAIADGGPETGFADPSVRSGDDRTFHHPVRPLRDNDTALSPKFGNIRDHLHSDTRKRRCTHFQQNRDI